MRIKQTRANDSSFDLNLAPVLDIIVSIIPMLLMSVAFVQIKMIEAPTPQIVQEQKSEPPKEALITLKISKAKGFTFEVTDVKGKVTSASMPLSSGQYDFNALTASAIKLKEQYPGVSSLQLSPEEDVAFDDIVRAIDQVRQRPQVAKKLSISEAAAAKPIENSYLFPDVIFSSIGG